MLWAARGLAPSLGPIFDDPRGLRESFALGLEGGSEGVDSFRSWYVRRYFETWVATVPELAVDVWLVTLRGVTLVGTGISTRAIAEANRIAKLGSCALRLAFDGVSLRWNGELDGSLLPAESALQLQVRLTFDGGVLDMADHPSMASWVVPIPPQDAAATLELRGRFVQELCELALHVGGVQVASHRWEVQELPPESTVSDAKTAGTGGLTPKGLIVDHLRGEFPMGGTATAIARLLADMKLRPDLDGWSCVHLGTDERWACHQFELDGCEIWVWMVPPHSEQFFLRTPHFDVIYSTFEGSDRGSDEVARPLLGVLRRVADWLAAEL